MFVYPGTQNKCIFLWQNLHIWLKSQDIHVLAWTETKCQGRTPEAKHIQFELYVFHPANTLVSWFTRVQTIMNQLYGPFPLQHAGHLNYVYAKRQ